MSNQELLALLPLITLSGAILVLMMAIAFFRDLQRTVAISLISLFLTALAFVPVHSIIPIRVTPLIQLDGFALYFSGLLLFSAAAVTLLSYDYLKDRGERPDEFFILLLLSTLGALVLVSSTHFASFMLGLELLGVSLYTMMSYPHRGLFTLEAALKYLILSGVSSTFILFGAALIYAIQGTLEFSGLSAMTPVGAEQLILLTGATMIFAGLMFKLSLAPFHMWTPDVYEGAPAPVTAYIATISKAAIFALTLRLFASSNMIESIPLLTALSFIAIISILGGNLLALRQDNIKRLLAYSSIAHIGYLLVAFIAAGVSGGESLAIEATCYFLFAYILTTLGAFGVVSIVSIPNHDHDATDISSYEGLFWRKPALAAMFTAMLLSLAGIPLTVGFIGKFYIFAAGVESDLWLLIAIVIMGSAIGIFYYLRIIFAMTRRTDNEMTVEIPVAGGCVMFVVTAALIIFGVYPTPVISLISNLALM